MPKIIKDVIWESKAVDQLDAITQYLAEYSPHFAYQILEAIFDAAYNLSIFPKSGAIVEGLESEDEVRRILVLINYEIRYVLYNDAIHILAVYHAKQSRPPFN